MIDAPIFGIALFAGMLFLLEVGRRIGLSRLAEDPERANKGFSALQATVFGLTSLVLAFAFSGALARYDARRQLIAQEANAIGTAYRRIDLLPPDSQPALREQFRSYIDSRLEIYRRLPDLTAAREELGRSKGLQNDIWSTAVVAVGATNPAVTTLVIGSLNEMIEITTTRTLAALSHPPLMMYAMIFVLVLASSLFAGRDMAPLMKTAWPHQLAFALILSVTAYVVMEIEYPRSGLITLDAFDRVLAEVREGMR
jgi:hypothetical protein